MISQRSYTLRVIPAKAGIQCGDYGVVRTFWIPAFAGMTSVWYSFASSERIRRAVAAVGKEDSGVVTLAQRVGSAVRFAEVVQVLVKHGFANLVRRAKLDEGIPAKLLRGMHLLEAPTGEPETQGRRFRAALTELGPTFIKFGQVLSTRPDLIDADICDALQQLQDRVTPLPFEEMASVLKEELGEDVGIDDVFAEFDKEPVASASLSQVYKATLKDGSPVAVKIQRPGIEKIIESDLNLMRRIAEWVADHVEETNWMDPVGIVDEFARSVRRELDFAIEGRVIERFRHNFEGVEELFVPEVYPELSGKRVLVMGWIDGVRLDAIDQYPARNCVPKEVAEIGCRIICQQVFEYRFFHADPHPGNVFITRDNQIAFLDYGMVGHLERTDAAAMADLLWAEFHEDAKRCVDALLLLTTSPDPEDRQTLEHEVSEFIAFEMRAIVGGGNVGAGIKRMVDILRHNHLQLAPRFSLLLKTLATIESVAHALDPQIDMIPIIQPFVERFVAGQYTPLRLMKDAEHDISALLKLGRQLPADVQQILSLLRRGNLKAQISHHNLDPLVSAADRASNRIAFGVITGSLVIGSSLLMRTSASLSHLGLAGYLIAGVLGIALVISILRSRNY